MHKYIGKEYVTDTILAEIQSDFDITDKITGILEYKIPIIKITENSSSLNNHFKIFLKRSPKIYASDEVLYLDDIENFTWHVVKFVGSRLMYKIYDLGLTSIHSAFLNVDSKGVLLVGPSMAGKSTSSLECLLSDNCEVLSSESAIIDETLNGYSLNNTIVINKGYLNKEKIKNVTIKETRNKYLIIPSNSVNIMKQEIDYVIFIKIIPNCDKYNLYPIPHDGKVASMLYENMKSLEAILSPYIENLGYRRNEKIMRRIAIKISREKPSYLYEGSPKKIIGVINELN